MGFTPKAPTPPTMQIPPEGIPAPEGGAVSMSIGVKDRSLLNPEMLTLVNMQPGRHYRWVRSRGDENHGAIAKARLKGYTVEKLQPGGVQTLVEPDRRPDGAIAIGDLVLMSCPEHLHKQRVIEKRRLNEQRMASAAAEATQVVKDMAEAKGASIIADADHGKITEVR